MLSKGGGGVFPGLIPVRVWFNKNIGFRHFVTHDRTNIHIFNKFHKHPTMVHGYITKEYLNSIGVNALEDYLVVSQVTHNPKAKYMTDFGNLVQAGWLNLGSFNLSTGLDIIPISRYKQGLIEKNIFLLDKNINLGQEEKGMFALISQLTSKSAVRIWDQHNNLFNRTDIDTEKIIFFTSLNEKAEYMGKITGNFYNHEGYIIYMSRFESALLKPAYDIFGHQKEVKSMLNGNYSGSRELLHQYAILTIAYNLKHIKVIKTKDIEDAIAAIYKNNSKNLLTIRDENDVMTALIFGVILPVCEFLTEKHKPMVKTPKIIEEHATITDWPVGSEIREPSTSEVQIANAWVVLSLKAEADKSIKSNGVDGSDGGFSTGC